MQRGVGGPQLRARLAAAPSALAPAPCPACPVLAPSGGLRRGEKRWGAWAAPAAGGGSLPPARAPGGAARGPLLGAHGSPCSPPVGPAPTRGGAARHSPLGGPWAVPRGRCSGGPASGAWGLPPVPRRACPLPGPSSPGAPARSHRPLPPPVPLPLRGRGKRKRLTPAAAGTGGARLPQRTKKPPRLWLLPPAKRHKTRILFNYISASKILLP